MPFIKVWFDQLTRGIETVLANKYSVVVTAVVCTIATNAAIWGTHFSLMRNVAEIRRKINSLRHENYRLDKGMDDHRKELELELDRVRRAAVDDIMEMKHTIANPSMGLKGGNARG